MCAPPPGPQPSTALPRWPHPLGMSGALTTTGGGSSNDGRHRAGGISPGDPAPRDSPEAPMGINPEPVHGAVQGGTKDAPPPEARPMELDESSTDGPAILPSQPDTARPEAGHQPWPAFRYVVLPNAAVRAPQRCLTDGMGLPAVACVPPPLAAPVNRCGHSGGLARRPRPPVVTGLPENITARGAVLGTELLHGVTGATSPGKHRPSPRTGVLATGR